MPRGGVGSGGSIAKSASAATVDINGHMVDEGVKIVNGTTMLAQDNLRDVMMLNVYVEKNDFTLTNDDKTVTIKGTVGEKDAFGERPKGDLIGPCDLQG